LLHDILSAAWDLKQKSTVIPPHRGIHAALQLITLYEETYRETYVSAKQATAIFIDEIFVTCFTIRYFQLRSVSNLVNIVPLFYVMYTPDDGQ
jgi:hypothetical protein